MAIQGQLAKTVVFRGPVTQATNETSFYGVDTRGYSWADVEVAHNQMTAGGTGKWVVLSLWEGTGSAAATNSTAGFTVVSSGTTNSATTASNQFVIPDGNETDRANIVKWSVNLSDKERYLAVLGEGVDGTAITVSYTARLYRAVESDGDATAQGVNVFTVV